jgi:citrate/tricarballylate utilization protein
LERRVDWDCSSAPRDYGGCATGAIALADPATQRADDALVVLLFLTSLTGLLLLGLRHSVVMSMLLLVHLGAVLALFVTLPYGKFVHGLYRTLALVKYRSEDSVDTRSG